ncbi:MAG: iron chelate uptake ABC transporter family permease subunit [Myxococcota bacterium]
MARRPRARGAFLGALAVTAAVASLAASHRVELADLLLAGIAVSLAASALSLGLQATADAATTFRAVRWSLGSLATIGWDAPLLLLPAVVAAGAVLLTQLRALQTLAAGAHQAATQGVNVRRVRAVCLTAGSVLVGAVVAAVGPLAFVGLLVPHLVRQVHGHAPRSLLPLSAVAGAGLLPLADGLARVVVPGRELPVGVVTALVGAPTLLALLVARRRA